LSVAIEKTNSARKVLQTSGWHQISEGDSLSPREREIILSLYTNIPTYWRWVRQSCRFEKPDSYAKVKEVIRYIEMETEDIVEVASPLDGTQ